MDQRRLELHELLTGIEGPRKVYFQPPENLQLEYPCIIYSRSPQHWSRHADNSPYANRKRYSLTVIDRNPDSLIPHQVEALPYISSSTHFTKDGLNHDIYTIYF